MSTMIHKWEFERCVEYGLGLVTMDGCYMNIQLDKTGEEGGAVLKMNWTWPYGRDRVINLNNSFSSATFEQKIL